MLDPLCCTDAGGTPQGAGTGCSAVPQACCFPNGSCQNRDPLCCDDLGGIVAAGLCQGDNPPLNGIDDACEGGGLPNPPTNPPAPHDRKKNRFITFAPASGPNMVAYRVVKHAFPPGFGFCSGSGIACVGAGGQGSCAPLQLCMAPHVSSPGGMCWVDAPQFLTQSGSDLYWSKCSPVPVFRVWGEPRIDFGDCMVIPVAMFDVFVNAPGPIENPTPLTLMTIEMPTLNTKQWADIVGPVSMGQWGPPDRFTSAADVLALQNFLNILAPTKPIYSAANLQAISAADPCLNPQVNTSDVLAVVQGAQGMSYGPPATTRTTDPSMCTPCP
jgi:hypothetical protein